MKKLVIFDLDGTLLNTSPDLNSCMNDALKKNGLPPISVEQTKKYIGDGARKYAERAVNANVDNRFGADAGAYRKKVESCLNDYNAIYNACANDNTFLYEGVGELLKKLKRSGVKIAIVSNKPQESTNLVYDKLLKAYNFDFVFGNREGFKHKPATDGVEYVLSVLGVDKNDAVIVGDGETDALAAKNCGIDFVAVLWGYRDKKTLKKAGCKCFAKNTDDLYNKIIFYFGRTRMKKLFNEFKAFISRGNILDMAVGVIIGSAFTAIVNALTNGILKPLINAVIFFLNGGSESEEIYTFLHAAYAADGTLDLANSIYIDWGAFISAIINFLLIAITIFAIVKIINKVRETLDYNEVMKNNIQRKLDADENLNELEKKWIARMEKKNPSIVPHKTVAVEPAPPAEPELSSTDKLLTQILEQLKQNETK